MGIFLDLVTTTDTIWTAKQLCEYSKNGTVSFDNAVQRTLVWNKKQKSLLIHSLIVNFMPPEFLANMVGGIYDMIDGKQRHNAISTFLDNQYCLTDIPLVLDSAGNEYNFNGKLFNELPSSVQDKITGRGLKISLMNNASQEIINEYFYRRNNGTALTNVRKTLVMAKSFDVINELSQHDLFNIMIVKKGKGSDEARNVVMKSFGILYFETKSLENKKIFPFMKRIEFTHEQCTTIGLAYDTILAAYNHILNNIEDNSTKTKAKILNRVKTKTHVITLVPVVIDIVVKQNIQIECFANWLYTFFSGNDGATNNRDYNNASIRGSAQVAAVETRLRVAKEDLTMYLNN